MVTPLNWIVVAKQIVRTGPVGLHRHNRAASPDGGGHGLHQAGLAGARITCEYDQVVAAQQGDEVEQVRAGIADALAPKMRLDKRS